MSASYNHFRVTMPSVFFKSTPLHKACHSKGHLKNHHGIWIKTDAIRVGTSGLSENRKGSVDWVLYFHRNGYIQLLFIRN